jgi:hypothetical protein
MVKNPVTKLPHPLDYAAQDQCNIAPKRLPEIQDAIEGLDRQIEGLSSFLGELEKKLRPVLSCTDLDKGDKSDAPDRTELGARINGAARRVSALMSDVDSLLHRIEL